MAANKLTKRVKIYSSLHTLLIAAVDEINALVPDENELDRRWNEAQVLASAHGLSDLDRRVIRASDGKDWRDHFSDERYYYGAMFRELAVHQRLPEWALADLIETVHLGVRFTLEVKTIGNTPQVMAVPKFAHATDRLAYAALKLAEAGGRGFRVIACKECSRLELIELGGKGRPRSDFCSKEHNDAYSQRQKRERDLKAARKHK